MLKEIVDNKINEIFVEYQEEKGIIDGDIMPMDKARLDEIKLMLCEHINKICLYQKKEPPSSYIYTDSEGNAYTKVYDKIGIDKFFTEISRRIAFGDCSDEKIITIYWKGKAIEYAGWKPNMVFEYKDLEGKTIWLGYFEEWNH